MLEFCDATFSRPNVIMNNAKKVFSPYEHLNKNLKKFFLKIAKK